MHQCDGIGPRCIECSVVNLNVLGDLFTNEPATFHRAALAKHPRGLVLCVELPSLPQAQNS